MFPIFYQVDFFYARWSQSMRFASLGQAERWAEVMVRGQAQGLDLGIWKEAGPEPTVRIVVGSTSLGARIKGQLEATFRDPELFLHELIDRLIIRPQAIARAAWRAFLRRLARRVRQILPGRAAPPDHLAEATDGPRPHIRAPGGASDRFIIRC